jgi:hypothetical protein
MGSGTSQLSAEDSAVLTKLLQDEMAALKKEGHTEQQIQERLAAKYNEIIQLMATPKSGDGNDGGGNGTHGGNGSGGDPTWTSPPRRTLHGNDRASSDPEVVELLEAARQGYADEVDTVLHEAAQRGVEIVECALADDENRQTALMVACEYGHVDVAAVLIDRHADLETRDKNGETALHYSVSNGHVDVVRLLLKRGANKEAKNFNGYSCLMMAADFNQLEIVRLLVSQGTDVEAKNHRHVYIATRPHPFGPLLINPRPCPHSSQGMHGVGIRGGQRQRGRGRLPAGAWVRRRGEAPPP